MRDTPSQKHCTDTDRNERIKKSAVAVHTERITRQRNHADSTESIATYICLQNDCISISIFIAFIPCTFGIVKLFRCIRREKKH